MQLVFATHNAHKAKEIQAVIPEGIHLVTLDEINCHEDIPETASTLEGNARLKAEYIVKHYGLPCFADDTGLEIEALHGEPGVYSARYAGEQKDSNANMQLVLEKMKGIANRKARFRTVIALYFQGKMYFFEGTVNGQITIAPRGMDGFGYDPIFEPENSGQTFSEMPLNLKNTMSHRARAFEKMVDFLKQSAL